MFLNCCNFLFNFWSNFWFLFNFLCGNYWSLLFWCFDCLELFSIFEISNNAFSLLRQILHQLSLLFTWNLILILLFRFLLCENLWCHFLNMFNNSQKFIFSCLVFLLLLRLTLLDLRKSEFLNMFNCAEQLFFGYLILMLLGCLSNLWKTRSIILNFS